MISSNRQLCKYTDESVKLNNKISFVNNSVIVYVDYNSFATRWIYDKSRLFNVSDVIEDNNINSSYLMEIEYDECTSFIRCLSQFHEYDRSLRRFCTAFDDNSVAYVIDRLITVFDENEIAGRIRIDLALDKNYNFIRYVKTYNQFKDEEHIKNKYELYIQYENNKISKIDKKAAII